MWIDQSAPEPYVSLIFCASTIAIMFGFAWAAFRLIAPRHILLPKPRPAP